MRKKELADNVRLPCDDHRFACACREKMFEQHRVAIERLKAFADGLLIGEPISVRDIEYLRGLAMMATRDVHQEAPSLGGDIYQQGHEKGYEKGYIEGRRAGSMQRYARNEKES